MKGARRKAKGQTEESRKELKGAPGEARRESKGRPTQARWHSHSWQRCSQLARWMRRTHR